MGAVQLWGGKILFRQAYGSKIAIDPACCCEESSESSESSELHCVCENLTDGGPYTYLATFTGVVAKDPVDCADCGDWNQQHEVDCVTSCVWSSYGPGASPHIEGATGPKDTMPCLGAVEITATDIGNGVSLRVDVYENDGLLSAVFAKDFLGATPMDLDNPGVIPPYGTPYLNNVKCDWTNATCTMTS